MTEVEVAASDVSTDRLAQKILDPISKAIKPNVEASNQGNGFGED